MLNKKKKKKKRYIWASSRENASSRISDQVSLKLASSATEASLSLEISAI